jgi:hypothetical protein
MSLDRIGFAPLINPDWLIGFGILALLIVMLGLIRRARGALWRGAGFAVLLLVLAGPQWSQRTTRPEGDIALILRDQSPSMALGSRSALADAADARLMATKPADTTIRTVTIPRDAPDGTPVLAALRHALATIPPDRLSGVVLITDGEATDAKDAHALAHSLKAPVSLLIPARGNETDRELRLTSVPRYGLVGHRVTLRFTVLDHGVADAGTPVPVTVSADGVRRATLQARVGRPQTVSLKIRHAGRSVVAVAARPLPGEVSTINDQAVFTIEGIRRRLSVLLIAGHPNQGLRTWRLLLKSDPSIRLINFTILREPTEILNAPLNNLSLIPFPIHQLFVRDIGKFDLIILDQFTDDGLLPMEYFASIAGRVRAGGALLMEAGPEYEQPGSIAETPLATVLPALPTALSASAPGTQLMGNQLMGTQLMPGGVGDPGKNGTAVGAFRPKLTRQGRRHPVTAPLAGLPMGDWYQWEVTRARRGHVLLKAPDQAPLLVLAHQGKGRVAMLLSDQFYLWARGALGDDPAMAGPAVPLLRRTVHWLLREPSLAANRLTARIANGQLIVRRRVLQGGAPGSARIIDPRGHPHALALTRVAPGLYEGRMAAALPGVWRAEAAGRSAFAAANMDDPLEYRDLAATDRKLRPLARAGGVYWLKRHPAPALAALLHPRHAKLITGERIIPLLPPLPMAALALALLAFAWWRERG